MKDSLKHLGSTGFADREDPLVQQGGRGNQTIAALTSEILLKQPTSGEQLYRLCDWFPRCQKTLHYIAQLISGSSHWLHVP